MPFSLHTFRLVLCVVCLCSLPHGIIDVRQIRGVDRGVMKLVGCCRGLHVYCRNCVLCDLWL
jgi:hypothetical protein